MMLARLLIFAMLAGAAATVVALGMGLPVWMLLLTYALAGSAALILGGALVALTESRQSAGFGGGPVDPVHVRVRRYGGGNPSTGKKPTFLATFLGGDSPRRKYLGCEFPDKDLRLSQKKM